MSAAVTIRLLGGEVLNALRRVWAGSIQRRLVLGTGAAVALTTAAFVWQMVSYQRGILERQSEERRAALAEALAINSSSPVLASDLGGIEEVIASIRHYPGLRYAMVLNAEGRVLGHSDARYVGQFVSDSVSLSLLEGPRQAQAIVNTGPLTDTAAPIKSRGVFVGWARVGVSQQALSGSIASMTRTGVLYGIAAVLLPALAVALLTRGLTGGLNRLVALTAELGAGNTGVRAGLRREDELGALGNAFDRMAAALEKTGRELRESELGLRKNERKYREIFNNVSDALILLDVMPDGGFRLADLNPVAAKLLDVSPSSARGRFIENVFPPERVEHAMPLLRQCTATAQPVSCEEHVQFATGAVHLDTVLLPVRDETGKVSRVIMVDRDVTERMRMVASLRQLSAAVEQSPVAVFITDTGGTIQYVNPAFCANSQYTAAEVLGRNPRILQGGDTRPEEYAAMWQSITAGNAWHGTFHNRRKDGTRFWEDVVIAPVRDATGAIAQFTCIKQDITARKSAEQQVDYLAHHDTLTGLPNRLLGRDRLEWAMAHAVRSKCKAALLFLDLDGFKRINDSLGHAAGDLLLKAAAGRLQACVRRTDTIARQGGDEFLIVLSDIRDPEAITSIAMTTMEQLARPFQVEGHELNVTASIGVAVFPDDGRDWDTLFKKADVAMYSAKEAGRNTYRFFTAKMNENADEYLRMRNALQGALLRNEFVLHYQPQIDLKSGGVPVVEALLRWNSADMGFMTPDHFIPLAEDSGLIVPIGDWVLREACRQAAAWRKEGLPKLVVAVNLSAVQFRSGDVAGSVKRALSEAGLDPSGLELEVTEAVLLKDSVNVLSALRELKALGVTLSIDDFGTGYSSLSYLRRYGADKVKIDQSFVRDLTSDANSQAVVDAIVQMARALGVTAIAEGVEDEDVLESLRGRDCDGVQGFYYARPMPAADISAFVEQAAGGRG
jgi:diguanylate cyclase (GGDEF)-like protein/PAS domain S-box-containing protein